MFESLPCASNAFGWLLLRCHGIGPSDFLFGGIPILKPFLPRKHSKHVLGKVSSKQSLISDLSKGCFQEKRARETERAGEGIQKICAFKRNFNLTLVPDLALGHKLSPTQKQEGWGIIPQHQSVLLATCSEWRVQETWLISAKGYSSRKVKVWTVGS